MIRGAVDYITPQAIGGWMFSDIASVKDRLVLAFHGRDCIGSGTIEMYRDDLAKAGLGDGFLGFNFSITLPVVADPSEVYVKLSDSDFILRQSNSVLINEKNYKIRQTKLSSPTRRSSIWMRERGWIRSDECEFLSRINDVGVYSRILARQELTTTTSSIEPSPDQAISDLFEVFYQSGCSLDKWTFESVTEALEHIVNLEDESTSDFPDIFALWTPGTTVVSVQEGGHIKSIDSASEHFSGIDYPIGITRVLFVTKDTPIKVKGAAPSQGLTVYRVAM